MSQQHEEALELARSGAWDEAHRLVQTASDPLSCLIHAYLHRVEGDLSNAGYWYRRVGEAVPDNTVEEEWQRLHERAIG